MGKVVFESRDKIGSQVDIWVETVWTEPEPLKRHSIFFQEL
jgi:hypothetical protein